ncbi:hypothetical protein CSHISOI_07782 [Colletotrichum shisoi]|uniref:NACHT-NTPase and P-loop NTPases N-terminal domain-containing protein n=1 Tax=Colletotrichum shisoi TaxID=2078593 RepID=A0A5Q4BL19_9PEZI|nr:hypothetical protein CSHISOI_07782 [Colletotrichum shisoi]
MVSGIEIAGLISAIITIVDTAIDFCDAIKDLDGLPEAFKQVHARLPLVREILLDAKGLAKNADENEASALKSGLENCQEKAEELKMIFLHILQDKSEDGAFVVSVYGAFVKRKKGLGSRVETLMQRILEDFQILSTYAVFEAAKKKEDDIEKARQEMTNVPPSIDDSDLEDKPGSTWNQNAGRDIV